MFELQQTAQDTIATVDLSTWLTIIPQVKVQIIQTELGASVYLWITAIAHTFAAVYLVLKGGKYAYRMFRVMDIVIGRPISVFKRDLFSALWNMLGAMFKRISKLFHRSAKANGENETE